MMMMRSGFFLPRLGLLTLLWVWGGLSALTTPASAQNPGEIVYRITVAKGLTPEAARAYRTQLESYGYMPINLDYQNNSVRVLYGNYTTNADALRAKGDLENDGFRTLEIVTVESGGAAIRTAQGAGIAPIFRVLAGRFPELAQANALKARLEEEGNNNVETSIDAGEVHVTVGRYATRTEADGLVIQLRDGGILTARVIETYEGTGTTARRSDPVPAVPSGAIPASRTSILPAITSSEIWETLSPDQQRAVALHVSLSDDIRSGNEVASRLIDLEKRYLNLDATTKGVIDQIDEERNSRASNAIAVQALLSDANSLATGGNVAEAILKLDEALALDPNN
ncbi:SPOR domain-containing protein, partial [Candidatus Sumerlaeota bacterium]|nr:SPOR domain-containing protein [Candidatus Sumerlaeota bacterium]